MKGRLNLFQSAMLRWRDLHPYTAVHVARIREPFDRMRVESAIANQLSTAGLTGLVLDRARRRYEYRGGPAIVELDVIAATGDRHSAMRTEIERQLNRPFPQNGALVPFRFFAHDEGNEFDLGLAYDHFIAGGDSIVVLLNDIVFRYMGASIQRPRPNLYPPTFRPIVARNAGKLIRGVRWLPRIAASCRRGIRPRFTDPADGYNAFDFITLPAPAVGALHAKAKSLGVTFNDLLIAIILKALARDLPERSRVGRRREIAVASIVNLRSESGVTARETFGQFLSSMRLSHPMPDGIALDALACDIHRETMRFKRGKLYLQTLLAVRINGIVWSFLNAGRRQRLYAKAYPVLAGLTSLNVDALWQAPVKDGTAPAYLRAVPTGPIAPLVIAATSSGNELSLGLSYRRSALTPSKVATIGSVVADCVCSLQ
ncbi:MAG TPA: hypothetical protein VGL25_16440 [Casimicrobiaceae bacterium]|jgi:hypothetical protein